MRLLADVGATGPFVRAFESLQSVHPLEKPVTLVSEFSCKHIVNEYGEMDILLNNKTKLSLENLILIVAPMVQHNILSMRHLVKKAFKSRLVRVRMWL